MGNYKTFGMESDVLHGIIQDKAYLEERHTLMNLNVSNEPDYAEDGITLGTLDVWEPIEEKWEPIEKIAETNPIGASLLELNNEYYDSVLQQAQKSFLWALIAAIVGLIFFLAAISFLLLRQPQNISYVSVICGALIEAISALNFYLFGSASRQLKAFHIPLDRTQRFILANDICNLLIEKKDETRAKLILTIADVPEMTDSERQMSNENRKGRRVRVKPNDATNSNSKSK